MHNDEEDGGLGICNENGTIHFGTDLPISPIKLKRMEEIKDSKRPGVRTPKKDNLRISQIEEILKNK